MQNFEIIKFEVSFLIKYKNIVNSLIIFISEED